jgi:hypothetical protein
VTYNSIAAAEAVSYGIPAFALAPTVAAPVVSNDLSKIETPYYPDSEFVYRWASSLAYGQYNLEELLKETKTKNQEFLLLKKSEEINISNQKEAQSFLVPRITLNSSLGYSFNRNTAGLFALNQSVGLNS